MTNLVLDSVLVMLVCFALGAAIAWLLAAALYPTRGDVENARRARGRTPGSRGSRGDERLRQEGRVRR